MNEPYDPSKRLVKLNSKTSERAKYLGNIGEELAAKLLDENNFHNIVNLNEKIENFPFADIEAKKGGDKFLISVKIRNRYESSGKINSRYKLGENSYSEISKLLKKDEYKNHIPAWVAISIEAHTYDAYFGTIEQLKGSTGVNMSESAKEDYIKFAIGAFHSYEHSKFVNKYELQ